MYGVAVWERRELCVWQALVSPSREQYDRLLRQLRSRMEEGCGETIYEVGLGSGETGEDLYPGDRSDPERTFTLEIGLTERTSTLETGLTQRGTPP
ncbi:unnamed protein product [Arctogadus glacialis]